MIPPRDERFLDMHPDGRFRRPAAPLNSWVVQAGALAALVAVAAAGIALATILLWVALWLIPIALVAGTIAWAAFRYQLWRMRRDTRRDVCRF